jgi:hypothetical protein
MDCMKGDQTLFARQDGIEAMWAVVDPITRRWEDAPAPRFPNYTAGSWGPAKADELLTAENRRWRVSCYRIFLLIRGGQAGGKSEVYRFFNYRSVPVPMSFFFFSPGTLLA